MNIQNEMEKLHVFLLVHVECLPLPNLRYVIPDNLEALLSVSFNSKMKPRGGGRRRSQVANIGFKPTVIINSVLHHAAS